MKREKALRLAAALPARQAEDRVFFRNPVFLAAMGLAPAVMAASTLENGLILALAACMLVLPTRVFGGLLACVLPYRMRAFGYALCGAGFYAGAYWVLNYLFGVKLMLVGVYLPLLVMDPLLISRSENPVREPFGRSVRKGLGTTVGYVLALLLISSVRELLSAGSLLGRKILSSGPMPVASLVCGGFFVIGVLAALWRSALDGYRGKIEREAGKNE